jgi:hypothetical protein
MGSPFAPRQLDTHRLAKPPRPSRCAGCARRWRGGAGTARAARRCVGRLDRHRRRRHRRDADAGRRRGPRPCSPSGRSRFRPACPAPADPGWKRDSDRGRTSTCSHQQPASGDGHRWCAFARPARAGATELWVFDLTALAGGDRAAPADLRRHQPWLPAAVGGAVGRLAPGRPSHPYSHAFDGDTLIFYADGSAGGDRGLHRGRCTPGARAGPRHGCSPPPPGCCAADTPARRWPTAWMISWAIRCGPTASSCAPASLDGTGPLPSLGGCHR